MRIVVLILGILGGAWAGFIGGNWFKDLNQYKELLEMASQMGGDSGVGNISLFQYGVYATLGAAAAGIIGGILGFKGKGVPAALLMLIVAGGAVGLMFASGMPDIGPKAAMANGGVLLAGLLAFGAKPKA